MTPRQRWRAAVELREPDRVPIDFGGPVSGILAPGPYGYRALCSYLGLEDYDEPEIEPAFNDVLNIDERVLVLSGSDVRYTCIGGSNPETLPDGLLRDQFGILLQPGEFFNSIPHGREPMRRFTSVREIEEYAYWPDPEAPFWTAGCREHAKRLRETTDYAIVAAPAYSPWILYWFLRGFDTWLIDMKRNRKLYASLADRLSESVFAITSRYLTEVGPYVDGVLGGEDLGHQHGPFVSVETFRECVKPWTKAWVQLVKRTVPHAKIMLHSCGSIYDLLPDLIDCGFEIINPIQPLADKMEPTRLKRDFGGSVCLHGGIDIQRLLPFSSPEQIRDSVRRTIQILAPGGGYVLAPSHNIESDTPPENIAAMFQAALDFREYALR